MSALNELEHAADAVQEAELGAAPASAALEELAGLRRQIDRLEAVWSARVLAVHESGAAAGAGYASTGAFLRHVCHLSPGAARARVDVALQIQDQPRVAAAFADGAISYPHVKVITDALNPLPAALRADAEPVLVEAARRHDPARVAQIGRRLRHIIDPDGQADADQRRHEQRWLEIANTFAGTSVLRGLLDAESAAVVRTAIDALATPAGELDARTPAQRRADALVELARRALDSATLPEVSGERPHITVTVDITSLRTEASAAAEPSAPAKPSVPAELASGNATHAGEPISARTARRLSCDAIVTRIITQAASPPGAGRSEAEFLPHYLAALPPPLRGPTQVLDVGRAARTATTAIRKALNIRDNGCVMPGCDRPFWRCEAHHVVHWADGGPTAIHNMVLVCAYHHRYIHDNGWHITVYPDRPVEVTPPNSAVA